jgi:LacI family transcriptional regulator
MTERKQPTVVDVATRAGVAVGTVSRVINHSESVSQSTREGVWRAIADLGFRPNSVARSMRTRVTHTIGFVIPDLSNPIFSLIARDAEEVLQNEGYMLNVANSEGRVDREVQLIKAFAERQCDGLMFVTNNESDPRILEALRSSRLPMVAIDRELALDVDRVMVDHARGVELAATYLLDLGHRRIALINVSERISPGRSRAHGFKEAHLKRGLKIDDSLIRSGRFDRDFGAAQVGLLLALRKPPTAIIAGGNQILVGVLQALQTRHLQIPGDISVIACDDTAVTQVFAPPITIVDRDLAKIGRTAAEILLDRLLNNTTREPMVVVLPTDLRIRGSCAPLTMEPATLKEPP